mgnify:CR=1 FL=1
MVGKVEKSQLDVILKGRSHSYLIMRNSEEATKNTRKGRDRRPRDRYELLKRILKRERMTFFLAEVSVGLQLGIKQVDPK